METEIITIEDWNEEETELKPYYSTSYLHATKKEMYETYEEAEKEAHRIIKKNPWGGEAYIIKILKMYRSIPSGGVEVQEIDVSKYIEDKTKEQ